MIEKLTKEQEEMMNVYRDKWIAIGLNTDRIDQKKGTETVEKFYKQILDKTTPYVIYANNPIEAYYISLLANDQYTENRDTKKDKQLEKKIRKIVQDHLSGLKKNDTIEQNKQIVIPYIQGSFWAGYFSFYDYFLNYIGIDTGKNEEFNLLMEFSQFSYCYTLDNVCVISEKPLEIHLKNGVLHNENGPAVKYAGDLEMYSLNGIRMSKEIVLTPAEQLDVTLVVKEKNADIRRELVRKIGLTRIYLEMGGKVLDRMEHKTVELQKLDFNDFMQIISKEVSKENLQSILTQKDTIDVVYELITLNLGDGRTRPYLKMNNPSMSGVIHIEGVPPEIKTVKEAITWRNGLTNFDLPILLS